MMTWLADNKDALAGLASITAACGVIVILVTAAFAYWKFGAGQAFERELRARDSYLEYLKYSIDFPEYYLDYWNREGLSPEDRMKYISFAAYMITSHEDVIELDDSEDWKESARVDFRLHAGYLARAEYAPLIECYSRPLQALLREVIEEYKAGEEAHA